MEITNWKTDAIKKIEDGIGKVTGQKEKAMAKPVADALKDFCSQEPEFSQAIVQGGSFEDCMKAVAKGVGSSISDLEAYQKAVQFYFPGAEIHMKMSIDLVGQAEKPEEEQGTLSLDLANFF